MPNGERYGNDWTERGRTRPRWIERPREPPDHQMGRNPPHTGLGKGHLVIFDSRCRATSCPPSVNDIGFFVGELTLIAFFGSSYASFPGGT